MSATAREVELELEALFGSSQLARAGVAHVTYAARDAQGRLCPLRIGPGVPRSETDFFVLSVCRARADAILTSAENVRREPALDHQLTGRWAARLAAYRAALGKHTAPCVAILTRSGDLPQQHPIWSDATPKLLLTSEDQASVLAERWAASAQVAGLAASSARSACAFLHAQGAALISVEAGPTAASTLYETPSMVDELLLTLWEDGPPHAELLAPPLPEDTLLLCGLALTGSATRTEAGHRFRFERWARG